MNRNEQRSGWSARIWILPVLVVLGLVVAVWQPINIATLVQWGQCSGTSPLFLAAVVVTSAGLFTFGLPGSLALWLIAPFNPPWLATVLLVVASTAGALGAYGFAGHLGRSWQRSASLDIAVDMLRPSVDVFTLTALRVLPGFPNSAINFACGLLHLPLSGFVAATVVGLSIKWGVYTSAIYGISDTVAVGDAIRPSVLLPLFVLVAFVLIGAWVRRRI